MLARGIFSAVNDEVGAIIVADVDREMVRRLALSEDAALDALIAGTRSRPDGNEWPSD